MVGEIIVERTHRCECKLTQLILCKHLDTLRRTQRSKPLSFA